MAWDDPHLTKYRGKNTVILRFLTWKATQMINLFLQILYLLKMMGLFVPSRMCAFYKITIVMKIRLAYDSVTSFRFFNWDFSLSDRGRLDSFTSNNKCCTSSLTSGI